LFLIGVPLLIIPFAIYNMIAFLLPGIAWSEPIAAVHLMSGADWAVTPSGLLVAGSIVVLLFEMVKAGRLANRSIVDHALSALIFIAMVAEFLLVKQAASGTFFLLVVIGFVDVVGGFAVARRSAGREMPVEPVENARHAETVQPA
jgi:hypothetical protein